MENKKRSIRWGAAIVLFAVVLRLGGGITMASGHVLQRPEQIVTDVHRWPNGGMCEALERPPVVVPSIPQPPQPICLPSFRGEDLSLLQFQYASGCHYRPDLQELISDKLSWDLDSTEPAVLILHTHGTESYTQTADDRYTECGNFRTRQTEYNMVALGELLTARLEAAGIRVIHDKTLHDDPSYNAAYSNARTSITEYLQMYPSIQLVLDLHRDAATDANGKQFVTSVTVDGQKIAQLMLVMGTDASGLHYPNWQANLSVALKLQAQLERQAPGITRTTTLRTSRYNQDLHSAMLLVEVGSAGNTLQQAMAAVEILAEAIIILKDGANG